MLFAVYYFPNRKKIHSGIITINKEGITDTSDDNITIKIGWNKVKLIVVTEREVVIVTELSWLIYADIDNQTEIIEGIKKYNQDVLLIKK